MLLLLAAAIVIRAPRMVESLWYDEIAAYIWYAGKGPWYVLSNYHDPSNHIFHSLLISWSVETATWIGSIEIAFRLPALLFSLLSIVAMFALAREVAGERAGWIAALLMALLPVSVLEGAEARGYSMMICFSAASSWALLRGWRTGESWVWIVYAIACALGVWSHLITVFVPAGHGLLALVLLTRGTMRRQVIAALIALCGAAFLTTILYLPALDDIVRVYSQERAITAESDQQPTLLGAEGAHALLQLGGSWYWRASLPGLVLFASGFVLAFKNQRMRLALAATFLALPLLILAVALAGSWVYARFMLFALPGAILLMSLSLDRLWIKRRALGIAALVAVAAASPTDLVMRPPRQPLRDAVERVMTRQRDASPVIALGLNVPDIELIYEPREFDIVFTTHSSDEFEKLIVFPEVQYAIVTYPHLLNQSRIDALRDAGFARIANLPGWADWGKGDVWVYAK